MKKLIIIVTLLLCRIALKAQYNPYYNPYRAAEIAGESIAKNEQIRQLNNVRFDEDAIKQNPAAYEEYLNFLARDTEYDQKRSGWYTAAFIGLGLELAGAIPVLIGSNMDYNDPQGEKLMSVGIGVMSVGLIGMLVGYLGGSSFDNKIISNKENFIFYLKTTNNGVGIVTLF